jgi:phosphocarrier protein HPr
MQIRHVAVINRLGLHARPCAQIVRHAARFRARVSLQFKDRCANARSIVAVMMLAAAMGSTITVIAEGPDEAQAIEAIASLFDEGFGEAP